MHVILSTYSLTHKIRNIKDRTVYSTKRKENSSPNDLYYQCWCRFICSKDYHIGGLNSHFRKIQLKSINGGRKTSIGWFSQWLIWFSIPTLISNIISNILNFIWTLTLFLSSMKTRIFKSSWPAYKIQLQRDQSFISGIPWKQMKLTFKDDHISKVNTIKDSKWEFDVLETEMNKKKLERKNHVIEYIYYSKNKI